MMSMMIACNKQKLEIGILYKWSYLNKVGDVYIDNEDGDTYDAKAHVCTGLEFTGTQFVDVDTTGINSLWIYDYTTNEWDVITTPTNPYRIENRTIGHYFTLTVVHNAGDVTLLNDNPKLCLDLILGDADTGLSFGSADVKNYMEPDTDSDFFIHDLKQTNINTVITFDTTSESQVVAPTTSSAYKYNCIIDWGDGSIVRYTDHNISHTYATIGTYSMTIYGSVQYMIFYNKSPFNVASTTYVMNDNGATTGYQMFREYMGDNINTSNWNTGNVTSFQQTWYGCSGLTTLDSGSWNTENTTSFQQTWYNCSNLTTLDTSSWNTEKVATFYQTWYNCSNLTTLDSSGWNTENVTSFYRTWYGCSGLTTLDTSNWNIGNVTTFNDTWYGCSNLTTLDTSNWNTGNVTSFQQTWYGCSSLTTLDSSGWNIGNVTSFYRTWYGCSDLTTLNTSNWNIGNVTTFYRTWYNCSSLTTLDSSGWNTEKVASFQQTWYGCSSLTALDTSNWNTEKVTSFGYTWYGCSSLTTLDTSSWNTGDVTSFYGTWRGCSSLTNLKLAHLNIASLTDANNMLYGTSGALTTAEYDQTLINWEAQTHQPDVVIHFGDAKYTAGGAAETARNNLIADGWNIVDGGVV